MNKLRLGMFVLLVLAGASALQAQCPPGLPPATTCHAGMDTNGAFFLIAVPANYNHRLLLWNHGYSLAPPGKLGAEDLSPLGPLLLRLGFAVAASSYRPDAVGLGGWAVADAAEDTENLRQQFIRIFGQPDLTIVLGASEGGLITAEIAERFAKDAHGNLNYHGALPLCGPLAGGVKNFWGAFDLRVVYQFYCQNLPRPNEPQYPLFLGLLPNNTITPGELGSRINQCTGVLQPAATRTPQQHRNLANILSVIKIPESFVVTDMFFSTFALAELVQVRTHGLSPVTNLEVEYTGSEDDDALNAGVFRAGSNEEALDFLTRAYTPNGRAPMPTLTMHTIGDGLVIVENENEYKEIRGEAHTQRRLRQIFTDAGGHCEFSASETLAAFQALLEWVQSHKRPTKRQVAALCEQFRPAFGDTCKINREFQPEEFETRIPKRESERESKHESEREP